MTAVELLQDLIRFDSTSCHSNVEITQFIERLLLKLEFEVEIVDFIDSNGVTKANLIAKKGTGDGGLAYFGHTDVVPAKPDAFHPAIENDKLYGRGSCDMKGSIACMLTAVSQASNLKAPIYITCTADEEVDYGGAREVSHRSYLFHEMVDAQPRGIIGEPTRLEVVYAHKGSATFRVTSHGEAAHSSTRAGLNANLAMIPFLTEMKAIHDETESDSKWQNDEYDPPSLSWNIGINDHTTAVSMKAAQSICTVYLRPMPEVDHAPLIERARQAASDNGLSFEMLDHDPPLYVEPTTAIVQEMLEITGRRTATTVSYTTDGTQLQAIKNLIVFGPGDIAQAHTDSEFIELEQLERGTELFSRMIQRWCCH